MTQSNVVEGYGRTCECNRVASRPMARLLVDGEDPVMIVDVISYVLIWTWVDQVSCTLTRGLYAAFFCAVKIQSKQNKEGKRP